MCFPFVLRIAKEVFCIFITVFIQLNFEWNFLRLLLWTHQLRPPNNWRVTIWIDNTSALDKIGLEEIITTTLHLGPETDTISDILAVKKEIGLTLDGEHVKSHQDLGKDKEVPLKRN